MPIEDTFHLYISWFNTRGDIIILPRDAGSVVNGGARPWNFDIM